MKKLLYTLCFTSLLFTSCDFSNNVSEHLSYLMKMSKEFGGSWYGTTESGCYKIEITNSNRLNNNKDSLDYYGTIIGRKFINDLGLNYSCLTLELISEKKVAIVSKSTSNTITFDLELINRFKNRNIEEYLIARKAIYACHNADNDNLHEAENWLARIDNKIENPFVKLARAHIERAKGNTNESSAQINRLIESNTADDLLNQYIGIYFMKTNDFDSSLSFFKKAARINKDNDEHLMNIGAVYYEMENYDSSAYYFTRVIERDSLNLKALYNRADCRFKENKNNKGCRDIHRILEIAPKANLSDSILIKCGKED